MPVETRSQRRRRQENETPTPARITRPQRPRRPSRLPGFPFRTAQADQAARYQAGRPAVRIRSNMLERVSGTLSGRMQPAPQPGSNTDETIQASVGRDESPADGGEWTPSLVIGSQLGEDLSAIQLAERKVAQWKAILQYHQEHLPGAVSSIQDMLAQAISEKLQLRESEDNKKSK